ncbi:MAG: exodeoxyribonuclease VII small subunit [Ignavibacteriae bacterium]|nr:exodeoxyribonuclease VII small subunit [Ignavibacteriota bacterium]
MSTRKDASKQTFEEALRRLEEIVEKLEGGDVSLEESLKMYEEGVTLSKACVEKLTQAELKMKRLAKDVEGNFRLIEEDPDEE